MQTKLTTLRPYTMNSAHRLFTASSGGLLKSAEGGYIERFYKNLNKLFNIKQTSTSSVTGK